MHATVLLRSTVLTFQLCTRARSVGENSSSMETWRHNPLAVYLFPLPFMQNMDEAEQQDILNTRSWKGSFLISVLRCVAKPLSFSLFVFAEDRRTPLLAEISQIASTRHAFQPWFSTSFLALVRQGVAYHRHVPRQT